MTYFNLDDVPEEEVNDAIMGSIRQACANSTRRDQVMAAPAEQLRQVLADYLAASESINEIPVRGFSEIVGEVLAEWPPHHARLMIFYLACWIKSESLIQFMDIEGDLMKAARGEP